MKTNNTSYPIPFLHGSELECVTRFTEVLIKARLWILTGELFYTNRTTHNFIIHAINVCFLRGTLPLQRWTLLQLQNIWIYLPDHKIYGKPFLAALFSISSINFSLQLREMNIKICVLVYNMGSFISLLFYIKCVTGWCTSVQETLFIILPQC